MWIWFIKILVECQHSKVGTSLNTVSSEISTCGINILLLNTNIKYIVLYGYNDDRLKSSFEITTFLGVSCVIITFNFAFNY